MATQFDFENIGSIFGGGMGGTPSGLDALLSEDQRKLMNRNAALSAAAALLQAGGRSPQRIGMGQAIGSALQAGQQGYQQARAGSLQDLLLTQKLQEAQQAAALKKQIAEVMTTAPQPFNAAQAALAAPGMPFGPTTQRAEMMDSMPQPTANETKANQYLAIADIYASQGKSEDAQRYQQIAERLNPRPEVTGQPFEVTDASGTPVLVQQMKSGALQTLPGFGPKREVVLQSLGGRTVAINKSALKGGESYNMTMTPGEIASNLLGQGNLDVARGNLGVARGNLGIAQRGLGLREQEFNRGAFDIRDTPEGLVYVPKAPGGTAMPIMGAGGTQLEGTGAKPTEDQSKSAGFAFRMKQSTNIFNQPILGKDGQPVLDPTTQKPVTLEQAYGQPSRYQAIMRAVPTAGLTTGIANVSETAGRQQYRQAQENWVTANLRPESGAVIGADEMEKEITKYFPQTNDKAETIAQKQRARRDTELAMTVRAGPAYKQIEKAVAARPQPGTGRLIRDPATGIFRYVTE